MRINVEVDHDITFDRNMKNFHTLSISQHRLMSYDHKSQGLKAIEFYFSLGMIPSVGYEAMQLTRPGILMQVN